MSRSRSCLLRALTAVVAAAVVFGQVSSSRSCLLRALTAVVAAAVVFGQVSSSRSGLLRALTALVLAAVVFGHGSSSRSGPLRALTAVVAVAVVFGHGSSAVLAGDCWQPPVPAPVTDPYREPACRWCPGNRGIEYATATGTPVRAVAAGTVGFAGVIAGERYVVVRHADGRRATYGGLADARVGTGDLVVAGTVVGTTTTRFHFGLRDGDAYVDPTPLLGQLVYRTRLVPSDGAAPAPAGPPRLRCGVATRPSSAVRPGRTPAGAV